VGATLRAHDVAVDTVRYRDRQPVRGREDPAATRVGPALAMIGDARLGEGSIEAFLAGLPAAGAAEGACGFIGLAYRGRTTSRSIRRSTCDPPTAARWTNSGG
jgi:hypothetical protein